jgi:hypothetical protein
MRTVDRSPTKRRALIVGILLSAVGVMGTQCPFTLSQEALSELADAGVNKYIGEFAPVSSVDRGDGWTQHLFNPDGGNGPTCIAGTPYSAYTRAGSPHHLLIFEQGGGACWQDFYFCNVVAEAQAPPFPRVGIWDFDSPDNPFANASIVYMPYCDGSVFSGDNDVFDPAFGAAIGVPEAVVRFHRGLRNQTASMDLAKTLFPNAVAVTVAGSSAGGVGVAGFAPFLVRFLYGANILLTVFNDAGPIAVNPNETAAIAARAADWQFGQFYPASCTECDDMGQATAIIDWRLDNDTGVLESWYETDGDATNRFFLNVPTQEAYRELILAETGPLHAAHPARFRRFIVSGDDSHTALQSPLFTTQTANGVPLNVWTRNFLRFDFAKWVDIVEDFVPLP